MDVTPILDSLNDAQREAVTAAAAPTLVIAGAGSGKTRVLVHRAAWLIDVEGVSPQGLLAVTFTNKAAAEMRGRIESLLKMPVRHLWIGTFHGLAHRLLRRHWREANLPQNFQIIDSDDQLRLIKRLLKNLEIDDSRWVPREIQYFINAQKDEGLRPKHLDDDNDPNRRQMIALYQAYEEVCERGGLVDFAELLLRAHELWRDNAELLAALPASLLAPAGRRVPGHERNPVRLAAAAGRQDRHSLRRRRRRPVDLPLARRAGRAHPPLPEGLSRHDGRQARAELPLDRDHPEGRQCRHREQQLAARQEPVDRGRGRRTDPRVRRVQRARRGRLCHRPAARLDRAGQSARRGGRAVSLERAVAGARGRADQCRHPVPRLRRPALLRARRDQGRAGLPAPDREPRRRQRRSSASSTCRRAASVRAASR